MWPDRTGGAHLTVENRAGQSEYWEKTTAPRFLYKHSDGHLSTNNMRKWDAKGKDNAVMAWMRVLWRTERDGTGLRARPITRFPVDQ